MLLFPKLGLTNELHGSENPGTKKASMLPILVYSTGFWQRTRT